MQAGAMSSEVVSGLLLLHLAVAVWTGVLAARWKRRNGWHWFGLGLVMPVVAPLALAMRPRRPQAARIETEMELQYLDGTRLLR